MKNSILFVTIYLVIIAKGHHHQSSTKANPDFNNARKITEQVWENMLNAIESTLDEMETKKISTQESISDLPSTGEF